MDIKQKLLDILNVYKKATYRVFTTSGLIATIILILLFISTYLINVTFNFLGQSIPIFQADPLAIVVAIISAILTMALWWILGVKYAPKLGALLTEKKIMNILFTKGDIHYFENVGQENLRIMPASIIAKFINLILSWFAVVAFLLGFLLQLFNGNDKLLAFFTASLSTDIGNYILKLVIVFVLAPILMTITIPIPWMLLDTRLKAYNSGAKINSFVGKVIQSRVNSLFAIGGIATLLIQNLSLNNFSSIILSAIFFLIGYLAFPTILIVTLYNMLFQVQYYESFLREIPVPFGTTRVEMETKFTKSENTKNQEPKKLDDLSDKPAQTEVKQEQLESTTLNTQQDNNNDSSETTNTQ